jgi:hypothetical protein
MPSGRYQRRPPVSRSIPACGPYWLMEVVDDAGKPVFRFTFADARMDTEVQSGCEAVTRFLFSDLDDAADRARELQPKR